MRRNSVPQSGGPDRQGEMAGTDSMGQKPAKTSGVSAAQHGAEATKNHQRQKGKRSTKSAVVKAEVVKLEREPVMIPGSFFLRPK